MIELDADSMRRVHVHAQQAALAVIIVDHRLTFGVGGDWAVGAISAAHPNAASAKVRVDYRALATPQAGGRGEAAGWSTDVGCGEGDGFKRQVNSLRRRVASGGQCFALVHHTRVRRQRVVGSERAPQVLVDECRAERRELLLNRAREMIALHDAK